MQINQLNINWNWTPINNKDVNYYPNLKTKLDNDTWEDSHQCKSSYCPCKDSGSGMSHWHDGGYEESLVS